MSTAAQIQAENERFRQALANKEITAQQYSMVMSLQNAKMASLQQAQPADYYVRTPEQQAQTVKPPPEPTMPLVPTPSLNYSTTEGITKTATQTGGIPPPETFQWQNLTPTAQETVKQQTVKNALAVAAPVAFVVAPEAAVAGAVLSPAISQGIKAVSGEGWLTPDEVLESMAVGSVFSVAAGGVIGAAGEIAPKLAGPVANPIVRAATRIGINTGLGAGASGLLSGGNPEAIVQGAEFGFAFGVAGEAIGGIAGTKSGQRVIGKVRDSFLGGKFEEVVGVREVSTQFTKGRTTEIFKLTEPVTETVTLRGKDLAYFRKNNLGNLREPTLDLAGTEKVYLPNIELGGKELEPIPILRQVESIRNADPLLAALKRQGEYKLAIAKTGRVNEFVETISDMPAIQRTKVTIGLEKNQPPGVFTEKTVIAQREALLPESKVVFRDFTGVKLSGKVDPQIYADAAKAVPEKIAQDVYAKLGGGTKQGSSFFDEKTALKGMKPLEGSIGSKQPGAAIEEQFRKAQSNIKKASGGNTISKQITAFESKEVTLPRAIVREVKASPTTIRFTAAPPSYATSIFDHEEEIAITYPKSGLATPPKLSLNMRSLIETPRLSQRQTQTPMTFMPKPTQNLAPATTAIFNQRTNPFTIPDTAPIIVPRTMPRNTQKTSPIVTPKVTPRTTIPTVPFNAPKFHVPKNPAFAVGGGFDSTGPRGGGWGRWFEKRHKIKTYSQMLTTFGVGKAGKPMRSIEKATNKLLKQATKKRRKK